MRKRLVQQGHSTLTISIPASWIKEHKLKAGDDIEIDMQDQSLVLSSPRVSRGESTAVSIEESSITLSNWILAACYKKGYDTVLVHYNSHAQLKKLNEYVKGCLNGYEIVEQGKTSVTVKSISTPVEEEFSTLFRRVFLVNLSFFKSIQESLKNRTPLSDCIYLEETNDSLVNLCERMIAKNRKIPNRDICFLYVILWQLEKIADTLKHFCQDVEDHRVPATALLHSNFSEITDLFNGYYEIYYSFNLKTLDRLLAKKRGFSVAFEKNPYFRLLVEQIMDLSGPIVQMNV